MNIHDILEFIGIGVLGIIGFMAAAVVVFVVAIAVAEARGENPFQ